MRRVAFLTCFVFACSSPPPATPDAGDAGPTDDVTEPPPPGPCHLIDGIVLPKTASPTDKVKVAITDAGSKKTYTTTWSVPSGTLSAPTGASVDWTIANTVAVHVKEKLTVSATATAEGCEDESVSADIDIDWPDAQRTIVIYNTSFTESKGVADYYATYRNIPADHLCAVTNADMNYVATAAYPAFRKSVTDCVAAVGAHVHYIVPVWGVPYRVQNRINDIGSTPTPTTTCLDALLAYGTSSDGMSDAVYNPYYQQSDSLTSTYKPYIPFGDLRSKKTKDYFMIARIDGADATAAKALVDKTKAADQLAVQQKLEGVVYVDGNRGTPHPTSNAFGSYEGGEWWIIGVENIFKGISWTNITANYDGAEFGTAPAPLTAPNALYYAGWYSYNHYNDVFTWNVGAIGGHLDSCSACDIRGTTSWSAAALRKGITATFGAVGEPYVAGMPAYDQFFLYLTSGASYGEAAAESTVIGAWMMLWVGDPLYRPYAK